MFGQCFMAVHVDYGCLWKKSDGDKNTNVTSYTMKGWARNGRWNFVIIHAEQPKTKNNNKQIRQWRELWKHLKRLQARFERNRCRKGVKGIKHETVNKCTRSYATFNKQRRDCKRWNSTTACGRSTCSIKVLKYILCMKPSPQFDYAPFPHKANSLRKWLWNTMTLMMLNRLLEKRRRLKISVIH